MPAQIYGPGVEKMKVEVRPFKFKSTVRSCPAHLADIQTPAVCTKELLLLGCLSLDLEPTEAASSLF